MKRILLAVSVLLAPGVTTVDAATLNIEISPAATTVNPGDLFSIDILAHNTGPALVGGGMDFLFNTAVVQVNSLTINAAIADVGAVNGTIDNIAGTVSAAFFGSFGGISGDFTFATVSLTAVGPGSGALTPAASNDLFAAWANVDLEPIVTTFTAGTVNVVPVPAAVYLFGSALAGLGWSRRKQAA